MQNSSDTAPLVLKDRWSVTLAEQSRERPPSMRIFGLIMFLGMGLLGGLALANWYRGGAEWTRILGMFLVAIGVVLLIWSLIAPRTLPPVYGAWMRFGQGIGTVVSTVLLSLLYLLIVTPTGWLMRLTGTDPIDRRIQRGGGSYWRPHAATPDADDYRHMA